MIEAGWPADRLFTVAVQTMNGLSNSRGGSQGRQAADPEFAMVVKSLRRIQASGAVGLRVDVDKDKKGEGLVMFFATKKVPPEIQEERDAVKRLLGLNPEKTEFQVIYGAVSDRDDVVAIRTRSGFQILIELASYVQIPEEYEKEKRAYPHAVIPPGDQEVLPPLIRIASDVFRPTDAFATVHYNGRWYWIENRDLASSELAKGGLVPIASGRGHSTAITIKQKNAVLWGGRLKPGVSVQVPDAPFVHLFIAKGSADLEDAGVLQSGDAVRLIAAGAQRLTADIQSGAEVLIWETNQEFRSSERGS
ncbi:MAG: hypothetical protein H8K07_04605 [Nitrospira sp.]|nr:hypothetical protein [Nitrospira sp.]